RAGPLVLILESQESRARQIREEYVIETLAQLRQQGSEALAWHELRRILTEPVQAISRKLGGDRSRQALELIHQACQESQGKGQFERHLDWIQFLLEHYYDPYYEAHRQRHQARVVFSGTRQEVGDWFTASDS